jgi:hypothetical protein
VNNSAHRRLANVSELERVWFLLTRRLIAFAKRTDQASRSHSGRSIAQARLTASANVSSIEQGRDSGRREQGDIDEATIQPAKQRQANGDSGKHRRDRQTEPPN